MIPSQRSSAPALPAAFLPGPDFVDRAWGASERSPAWLRSFQALFDAGRLAGTGHLCLLAGQGEPEAVALLAQEGGCSGLVAGERALGAVARRFAHRVPLIAEVRPEREPAAQARRLRDMGCVGVCLSLDERGVQDPRTLAVAAAATTEGLVVMGDLWGYPALGGGAGDVGAALAWLRSWPERRASPYDRDALRAAAAEGRSYVASAWRGRVGCLANAYVDRDVSETSVAARRAGALGVVVAATPDPDPTAQVAALHALQDVWADGSVTAD